jgi:hypothetical protein
LWVNVAPPLGPTAIAQPGAAREYKLNPPTALPPKIQIGRRPT